MWLDVIRCGGAKFDGCVILDECHKAKNLVWTESIISVLSVRAEREREQRENTHTSLYIVFVTHVHVKVEGSADKSSNAAQAVYLLQVSHNEMEGGRAFVFACIQNPALAIIAIIFFSRSFD